MADEFFGQAPQEEIFDPDGWEETPEYSGGEPEQQEEQQEEQPQEQEQEQYEAEPTPLIDRMRSQNYDVEKYETDEQLLEDIQSGYQSAVSQQQELQRQLEGMQQQQQQNQEYYDADADDDYEPEETDGAPEFDPSWANLVEQDEGGRFVVRAEYVGSVDPSIAEKVNEYVGWRQARSNSLIENPVDTLMDAGLEDYIEARIENALSSNFSERDTQSHAEAFVQQNENILYDIDPSTGTPYADPQTGSPVLSQFGNALNNAHVMLLEQGMNDPVQRHQVAVQLAYAQSPIPQQEQYEEELNLEEEVPQAEDNDYHKEQYQQQPFADGPTNPEYMPSGNDQPQADMGQNGLPEHNSLGSLATQLAVHKGFLQPKV